MMVRKEKMTVRTGRRNGAGSLYKAGGIYYGRLTVNGTRHTVSTRCTRREDAVRYMDDYTLPLRAGDNKAKIEHLVSEIRLIDGNIEEARRRANDYPIGEIMDKVTLMRKLATSTRWDYQAAFGALLRWLAVNHPDVGRMSQITKEIAVRFRDHLASRKMPGTAGLYIMKLKSSWNVLADETGLQNPWTRLSVPGRSTPRKDLTEDEFTAVMEEARKSGGDVAYLFELAAETCMRLSDCCLMKWPSVDLARRVITFVPQKLKRHGKSVQLPMSQRVYELISQRVGDGGSTGYVCPKLAHQYETWHIRHYVSDLFRRAGIPPHTNKSFHSLRVHAITRMLENGIPLATVQAIAGHASPEMTQHYYRMDLDRARAALDGLSDTVRNREAGRTPPTAPASGGGDILSIVGALSPEQRAALKQLL